MTDTLFQERRAADVPCALSIIVPTFNAGANVSRCLKSIGEQVFTNYEVVLQDNSSDNTSEIVRRFQEQRPDIVIRWCCEPDTGVYDAMNKAVLRCNGDWLFFLGSDDELADGNALQRMLGAAPPSNVGVLYGDVKIVGDTPWAKDGSLYDGAFDLEKLLTRNICHQAMFYRASLARRVGAFNAVYKTCADWDFNMRCWSQTDFLYRSVTVANFYAGGVSSDRVFDPPFQKDFFSNVWRYGLLRELTLRKRLTYFRAWIVAEARSMIKGRPAAG